MLRTDWHISIKPRSRSVLSLLVRCMCVIRFAMQCTRRFTGTKLMWTRRYRWDWPLSIPALNMLQQECIPVAALHAWLDRCSRLQLATTWLPMQQMHSNFSGPTSPAISSTRLRHPPSYTTICCWCQSELTNWCMRLFCKAISDFVSKLCVISAAGTAHYCSNKQLSSSWLLHWQGMTCPWHWCKGCIIQDLKAVTSAANEKTRQIQEEIKDIREERDINHEAFRHYGFQQAIGGCWFLPPHIEA